MKSHRLLVCFIISILMFTSCAKAPSEVDKEIENYDSAQTVSDTDTNTDTLTISEAIQQACNFDSTNKTNINIQNLILPESTKMPTYIVRFDNSKVRELFTHLQSEPLFENKGGGKTVDTPNDLEVWKNRKDYCFTAFPELNGVNYYRSASDVKKTDQGIYYGQTMRMNDAGSITFYADEQKTGVGSVLKYPVQKRFLSGFSHNDESYALCDGKKMSVSDAVKFSEKFCNDKLSAAENKQFEYQVNYADVRQVSPDKFGYYISICRRDKYGNLFDATPIYAYTFDDFKSRDPLIASPIYLWITSADSISEFEKNYTFSIEEADKNDKIVPLKTAVDTLSKELAQGKSYDFDTAELKYVFEITRSDYIDAARDYAKSSEYNDNNYGIVYSPESIYAYGEYKITAVPYWVFTDITAQNTDSNCGMIFMINALDGKLRIENTDDNGNQKIHY